MLLIADFLLVAFACTLVSLRARTGFVAPAPLYAAVWSLVVVTATWGARGYLPFSTETWMAVFLGLGFFMAGCAVAGMYRPKRRDVQTGSIYDDRRLRQAYAIGMVLLLGSVALDLSRILPLLGSVGGVGALFGGQGLAFREAQITAASTAATTSFSGGSLAIAVLGYVLFIGYGTVILAGYFAARGDWARGLLPVMVLACYSVFTLQRFIFIYTFIIFLCSLWYHRRLMSPASRASLRPLVWTLVVVIAVVFVPLQLRGQATTGTERYDSVVDYFAGGLAGFNTSLREDVAPPGQTPAYGGYTFYGAESIVARLGVPVHPPENLLPYSSISQTRPVLNNVGTYLIYAYYDLGLAGIALVAFGMGLAASVLHRAVAVGNNVALIAAASIGLTTVAMSFFGLSLVRDIRWLILAACSIPLARMILAGRAAPSRRTAPVETPALSAARA